MTSINRRLLSAASVVLVVFLGLTGYALDRAFRASAAAAERDRLQGHVYALLAAAELQDNGAVHLPRSLPEARFATPDSGLYARILNAAGKRIWQSASALGVQVPFAATGAPGHAQFQRLTAKDGTPYYGISFTVVWQGDRAVPTRYAFQVTEDLRSFLAQVSDFRRSLWGWLAAVALVLLAVQGSILRWGLRPLRKVAGDLEHIKSGRRAALDQDYPKELQGLTESINTFIASERAQRDRYRNTMGDLAHSLKTPLAVLRGTVDQKQLPDAVRCGLSEQVDRMTQIVEYQLQRAATAGKRTLAAPVPLAAAAQRVRAGLDKVYTGRGIECVVDIEDRLAFIGDEGDLLEMLGNLMDNAYKWARGRVRVSARHGVGDGGDHGGLTIGVEDDGPGVPEQRRASVLGRGVRADQAVEGQGIGLAVVQDIVRAYGGALELTASETLGGARLALWFPDS